MGSSSDDLLEVVDLNESEESKNYHNNHENGVKEDNLTNEDEMVYDRQIRLWGLQAQKKIMNSNVLFLGKNGIQEECMKNLLLAGMNITLMNDSPVSEQDIKFSFFLKDEDLGNPHSTSLCKRMSNISLNKKRLTGVNTEILFEEQGVFKFKDPEMLKSFDVVCVSTLDYPLHKLGWVNQKSRELGIAFFASMSFGTYGYFFTDLNKHTVLETFNKRSESVSIEYRSLNSILMEPKFPNKCDKCVRTLVGMIFLFRYCDNKEPSSKDIENVIKEYDCDRKMIEEMFDMFGKEFPVTSSVLGGYLALEVRKFVTRQHETIPNFCVFDMKNSTVTTAMI